MYNKGLYHPWVPKVVQVFLIFLTLILILPAGGIYTGNISVMYPDLGAMSEHLSFANNATTIGMTLAIPLISNVIKHFRFKEIVVGSLSVVAVLSLVISQTENPYQIMVLSLVMGFIKYFALIVFILPVMKMVSPKMERAKFYIFFYPFSICLGQLATYASAQIAYYYNWRYVYMCTAISLLFCILLAIVFMHNKRGGKQVKMSNIDIISPILLGSCLLLVNYVLTFAKQQDWLNSGSIQMAIAAFIVALALFIYRQSVIPKQYLGLRYFKTRNVLTSILVVVMMGMYLGTGMLQTAFTNILGYDNPTNNLLNIAMLPGIILGGMLCSHARKRNWEIKIIIFIAFASFQMSAVLMYFLISPVIQIEYLIIPVFLKGIGMCILFISVSLYIVDKIGAMDMMPIIAIFMAFRTFLGTSIFTAIFAWALYKLQLQQVSNLATGIDSMNLFSLLRGDPLQVYGSVSVQATLMAIKQIFGYVALAGIIVLAFVMLHRFDPLHARKLILSRKRFRGESTKGYREKGIPLAGVDLPGAAMPTSG
jgi:DHA2 family multidrug resistance protein